MIFAGFAKSPQIKALRLFWTFTSLTDELIVKQSFISLLLPFVPKWAKGQTTDNIRVAINNAWSARKKAIRQANH